MITFITAWIIATSVIIMDQVVREQLNLSTILVVISAATALLPAFIVSFVISTIPGVKVHLATYVRPMGAPGLYLLALVLFPAIWLLGIIVSRAIGMEVPDSNYPTVDVKLIGMVLLFFLMNFIHGGKTNWRLAAQLRNIADITRRYIADLTSEN